MLLLFGLLLSLFAAVIPTLLYAMAFYWADRCEREPFWLATVAFLWGALPAIWVSLLGEILIGITVITNPGTIGAAVVETALIAPVIEELAKGFALLLIVLFFRREFDGILDGLIYGALIGFGFAMTENFFYFVGAYTEGGILALGWVIFLRAILFGLNHAFYTALTGLGLGLGYESRGIGRRVWPVTGLLLAILAHSLHNLGASLAAVNSLSILLSLALAAFGAGLLALSYFLSLRRERSLIRLELADEIGALLSPADYQRLCGSSRPAAGGHAAPKPTRQQRRRMQLYAKLAFRKHRLRHPGAATDPHLDSEIIAIRQQIGALSDETGSPS